ncbi:hypothetical protein B0H14DRAFT_2607940 [Mycena olivaceomarginata]|nr:hypothetical protein B0H14DRAFT_2607940 [Mycena olivaceomarginata]
MTFATRLIIELPICSQHKEHMYYLWAAEGCLLSFAMPLVFLQLLKQIFSSVYAEGTNEVIPDVAPGITSTGGKGHNLWEDLLDYNRSWGCWNLQQTAICLRNC